MTLSPGNRAWILKKAADSQRFIDAYTGRSNDMEQVSEDMLRAGDAVLKRADFSFWEKMEETEGLALIEAIYLAMKAKEPACDVERVALAICDAVDERSCFASEAEAVRCYSPHARAAIASMPDDGLREALAKRIRHFDRCIAKAVEDDPDDTIKIGNLLAGQHALKDFATSLEIKAPVEGEGL